MNLSDAELERANRDVDTIVARARAQDQVDALCVAVAWAVARPERAEGLAKLAVDEARFGNFADKVVKINKRVPGLLADMRNVPSVGWLRRTRLEAW